MRRWPTLCALLLAGGLTAGCVERRYVVVSEPPGALVYRDGRPIGNTPCDDSFIYYGKYHLTLVKDGYETLNVEEDFSAPWYEFPGLDFLAENVWPFKIRDVRRPSYQLQPQKQVSPDLVLQQANELRARGKTLVPFNPNSVPNRQQAGPPAPPTTPPQSTSPGPVATTNPPPANMPNGATPGQPPATIAPPVPR